MNFHIYTFISERDSIYFYDILKIPNLTSLVLRIAGPANFKLGDILKKVIFSPWFLKIYSICFKVKKCAFHTFRQEIRFNIDVSSLI